MPIHWAYKDPHEPLLLEQGDVLRLTEPLVELLRLYHPYYADHPENRLYIVLTQSCDLVLRGGGVKSRYITIAPVRPLPKIIEYEFSSQLKIVDGIPYGSARVQGEVEKFLERLFNNNESSYFYLEPEPAEGIADPMCAMLRLGISFKADHLEILLGAKVLGLEDSFQAKLGWLLGQGYSRVGTKDFEPSDITKRAKLQAETLGLWIDAAKYVVFDREVKKFKAEQPTETLTVQKIDELISKLPSKKGQAIEAVLAVAEATGLIAAGPSPQRFKLRRGLDNDSAFANQFRE